MVKVCGRNSFLLPINKSYRLAARTITIRKISIQRALGYLKMDRKYNFYSDLRDILMCGFFGLFEVKVPAIFFGTEGFSARRDGRYIGMYFHFEHAKNSIHRDTFQILK